MQVGGGVDGGEDDLARRGNEAGSFGGDGIGSGGNAAKQVGSGGVGAGETCAVERDLCSGNGTALGVGNVAGEREELGLQGEGDSQEERDFHVIQKYGLLAKSDVRSFCKSDLTSMPYIHLSTLFEVVSSFLCKRRFARCLFLASHP